MGKRGRFIFSDVLLSQCTRKPGHESRERVEEEALAVREEMV